MKTISLLSIKGGTGKSTLSRIILNALCKLGFKCLAIDTDMGNHSLSFYYNKKLSFDEVQEKNIYNVFAGKSVADNVFKISDNLDLLHADVRLSDFRSTTSLKKLKTALAGLTYDYVIIDCAPVFDNVTVNVLSASDILVIPVVPDVLNHQSLKYLFSKLPDLDNDLDLYIAINQYEKPRTGNKETLSNQVIDIFTLDEAFKNFIIPSYVSRSSVIKSYVNNPGYLINKRKETAKQLKELGGLIKTITGLETEEI